MTAAMLLLTLIIFLLGAAIGWRFRVASVYALCVMIIVFVGIDLAVERITLWPITHWVIVDLIAAQMGYLTGAVLGFLRSERKGGNREETDRSPR